MGGPSLTVHHWEFRLLDLENATQVLQAPDYVDHGHLWCLLAAEGTLEPLQSIFPGRPFLWLGKPWIPFLVPLCSLISAVLQEVISLSAALGPGALHCSFPYPLTALPPSSQAELTALDTAAWGSECGCHCWACTHLQSCSGHLSGAQLHCAELPGGGGWVWLVWMSGGGAFPRGMSDTELLVARFTT